MRERYDNRSNVFRVNDEECIILSEESCYKNNILLKIKSKLYITLQYKTLLFDKLYF